MTPWLDDVDVKLYHGDCLQVLRELPSSSVHMCATSPPFYGLRDYGTGEWEGGQPDCDHKVRKEIKVESSTLGGGTKNSGHQQEGYGAECGRCGARRVDQQIGLEETPDQWVERLVNVFREVRRVLRDDGTLWVEIGDSFNSGTNATRKPTDTNHGAWQDAGGHGDQRMNAPGLKTKDLLGQPWLLAFALRADGWWLRSEIIWARPNPMPESVTDRPTKSHSTVFLLSKQPRYFYDADAIREPPAESTMARAHLTRTPSPKERNGYGEGAQRHSPSEGTSYGVTGVNARSVWTIPTQPTPYAHFATWPEALVRRMILAGTSEKGCCPECGAPWVRDTERLTAVGDWHADDGKDNLEVGQRQTSNDYKGANYYANYKAPETVGWSPSCTHDHQPVPCTVLDPFAGSATTNLVARHHGRHSIGIELNETYLGIAAKRLQQLSLLA